MNNAAETRAPRRGNCPSHRHFPFSHSRFFRNYVCLCQRQLHSSSRDVCTRSQRFVPITSLLVLFWVHTFHGLCTLSTSCHQTHQLVLNPLRFLLPLSWSGDTDFPPTIFAQSLIDDQVPLTWRLHAPRNTSTTYHEHSKCNSENTSTSHHLHNIGHPTRESISRNEQSRSEFFVEWQLPITPTFPLSSLRVFHNRFCFLQGLLHSHSHGPQWTGTTPLWQYSILASRKRSQRGFFCTKATRPESHISKCCCLSWSVLGSQIQDSCRSGHLLTPSGHANCANCDSSARSQSASLCGFLSAGVQHPLS